MTREEAIDILQNTSFFGRTMDDIDTAIDMAIEALDQEPKTDVLDKIKAEIYEEFMTVDGGIHDVSAKKCMQIIDKYKAESEDKG